MTTMNEDARPGETPAPPYDLFSQAFLADPFPTLRRMRAENPVYWHPLLHGWVLTRYDDIQMVMRDRRFVSERSERFGNDVPAHMREQLAACDHFLSLWMVFVEPPRHTVLRGLIAKAFTAKIVEGLRPYAESVVDDVLDAAIPTGKMDLVKDLAGPLPALVIAKMLGIPSGDIGQFKSWTNDVMGLIGAPAATEEVIATCHRGVVGLLGYFHDLIRARRKALGDDLLSQLITVEEQGTVLTEEELVATCALILVAGHETTTHLVTNSVLALLRHPAELETLRAHPELLPGAVEEMLRYDSAAMVAVRRPLEDVEVGGQRIEKGQFLYVALHAGNHDPAHFTDPDRLDVRRKDVRHLGLGHGIHYCLGAPLARLETQVALGKIVARLPELRLAEGRLEWIPSIAVHGLVSLPVAFQAQGEDREQPPASLRDVQLPPSRRVPPSIPPSSRQLPSLRRI